MSINETKAIAFKILRSFSKPELKIILNICYYINWTSKKFLKSDFEIILRGTRGNLKKF
jgi:hypothetical protein